MRLNGAISETAKLYPKGEDAIRKNYSVARTAIDKAKRKFGV
jgi:hypothetical protein